MILGVAGNSGIGADTVRVLAHAGARVFLASRVIANGEKVAAEFKAAGVKVRRLALHTLQFTSKGEEGYK